MDTLGSLLLGLGFTALVLVCLFIKPPELDMISDEEYEEGEEE